MAFNVNEFISNFDAHSGFARVSKFEVRITQPPVKIQNSPPSRILSLQCESAELPGYTINTVESKIFGAATFVAAGAAYNDITLTFICTNEFWEKKFFDTWMDAIMPKNSYLLGYKEEYQTTIDIIQYADFAKDEKAKEPLKIFTCRLLNAYPVSAAPLQLNWAGDDIHRLAVTFKYDKWKDADSAGAPVATAPSNGLLNKVQSNFGNVSVPSSLPINKPVRESVNKVVGGGGAFGGGGANGSW